MVWNNYIDNLFEKLDDQFGEQNQWEICLNNQVHKLGVKFGDIIRLKNIVERWVDNLAEQIMWNIWVDKLSCTVYGVHCTVYSKVVPLSLLREP